MAALSLDSDFVFDEYGIIRRLEILLVDGGSLSAEKKVRWRRYCIRVVCAGLL